ncbi:hypothetical protein [Moheibacter sediminis]|uniref:Uncharacterized protein n=1 Tax=Moheibacter sediminis TaxID=1434700 RepID=A0A1W2AIP0_9FLAO|nr:hypothetical protein [Moheibacter sediminis]SMC60547.1 hypothetical protein SAMN06296427_104204 [Moheibacter sediminis]
MKTLKISSLFLSLFLLFACSKQNPTEENESKSKSKMDSTPPSNLISLNTAKEQLDNYNEAHPLEVGSEYAVRTWISIEELKAYIAYIEKESTGKGIEVSGIDFIHTQYKEAAPGSPNPNNTVYDLTLMLAPTYAKENGNVAFDPIYSEQGKPKDLKDLFEEIKLDSLLGSSPGSSIANGLQTCPNYCFHTPKP